MLCVLTYASVASFRFPQKAERSRVYQEREARMSREVRAYWRGCRCFKCRVEYARYCRAAYLKRAKKISKLVPITRARKLLLQFESSEDAARVVKLPQTTCWRIIHKRVRRIRVETEEKILRAVA
jgi:hypothetical protein